MTETTIETKTESYPIESGPRVAAWIIPTVQRVEWMFVTTEDYYVRVGDRILGIVGVHRNDTRWTVTGDRDYTTKRFAKRSYATRDAAVSALVRYYIKTVGVSI